jgi:hypothetical protein
MIPKQPPTQPPPGQITLDYLRRGSRRYGKTYRQAVPADCCDGKEDPIDLQPLTTAQAVVRQKGPNPGQVVCYHADNLQKWLKSRWTDPETNTPPHRLPHHPPPVRPHETSHCSAEEDAGRPLELEARAEEDNHRPLARQRASLALSDFNSDQELAHALAASVADAQAHQRQLRLERRQEERDMREAMARSLHQSDARGSAEAQAPRRRPRSPERRHEEIDIREAPDTGGLTDPDARGSADLPPAPRRRPRSPEPPEARAQRQRLRRVCESRLNARDAVTCVGCGETKSTDAWREAVCRGKQGRQMTSCCARTKPVWKCPNPRCSARLCALCLEAKVREVRRLGENSRIQCPECSTDQPWNTLWDTVQRGEGTGYYRGG